MQTNRLYGFLLAKTLAHLNWPLNDTYMNPSKEGVKSKAEVSIGKL